MIEHLLELINSDSNDLETLKNKLIALEQYKYKITKQMVVAEQELLKANEIALNSILSDLNLKQITKSSTMTKDVLNAKNNELYARYRLLEETLRNIRGTIDSTRTLISLEKSLATII